MAKGGNQNNGTKKLQKEKGRKYESYLRGIFFCEEQQEKRTREEKKKIIRGRISTYLWKPREITVSRKEQCSQQYQMRP